ncbi:hypothetical protein [Ilyobacter polytropus]|uniref:Uncharacterized protein n=1 Tax=Ilyobacter polytropus (strain ATCC 51220 / DSM 2926 / LMG 16218 / CuHBu1) TaxID=572544 RepID=E3H8D4_ILYPC|nr:hypothetical protein [Ilyobacter polytropus]ADO82701.1 conserved hypothetical protein [Ilyobacter polytropus DSM 2926]
MEYKLSYIQNLLSEQNYLEFDKVLTDMLKAINNKEKIEIIDSQGQVSSLITCWDELEDFKKIMIQIYGIFGYF